MFAFPTLNEAGYRLFRLRRLILFCVALPVLALLLLQLVSWPFTGVAPGNVANVAVVASVIIVSHAMLFPNGGAETKTISLAIVLLVVASLLAGGSILGWVVLVLTAVCVGCFCSTG